MELEYHRLYSLPKEIFEKILWLYTKRWAGENMNKIKISLKTQAKLLMSMDPCNYVSDPLFITRTQIDQLHGLHGYRSKNRFYVIVDCYSYIYYTNENEYAQFIYTKNDSNGNTKIIRDRERIVIEQWSINKHHILTSHAWQIVPRDKNCPWVFSDLW